MGISQAIVDFKYEGGDVMRVDGVIFDMDGLILDTEKVSHKCFTDVTKKYGYEMDKDFYCTLIGRNLKGIRELFEQKYGKDFPFDKIYEEKIDIMMDFIDKNGVELKKGVLELLEYLAVKNYKIALATSTKRERATILLDKVGIREKFMASVCGDEVINSKPDPEIFLKAAEKLGVKPENCIVLEDSGAGIEAAYNAGMIPINVPDMKVPDEEMKERAFKICDSLLDVIELLENA